MTKPVLLAGLLGGLLGGVGAFVLLRSFPPATPKPVAAAEVPARSEVRERADDLIAKIKAGKDDEFFDTLRAAYVVQLNEEQFAALRKGITELRQKFVQDFGAAGDYEYSRETVLSESLVRVAYTAKFARGCVMCFVVFYRTADGWRILAFTYQPTEAAFGVMG